MFPAKRFQDAGASLNESDQLEREFERSDVGVQESMLEHFAAQSTSGLRDYLANLREIGHFSPSFLLGTDYSDSQSTLEADSEDSTESGEEVPSIDVKTPFSGEPAILE